MRPNSEPAIGSEAQEIENSACARLWRAVLAQVLGDALIPLPSGAVTGAARPDKAFERATTILEARAMIMDPCQAQEFQVLLDYAGVDAISPATRRRVQAAIDADAAIPDRSGWYLTGGGYALFRRPAVDRTSNHGAVLAA